MKLFRKIRPSSPRVPTTAAPPKSPTGPSGTGPPAAQPPSPPVRRDDFGTGAARPRSPPTEQVRGPDASGAKKPTSNADIRKWYLAKVNTIPELDKKWAAEGVPLPERARRAVQIRHEARREARAMMQNPLEVAMLHARDLFKYGNIHGPSFEQLVQKAQAKGLQGDEVWRELLGSSNRTNQTVNQHLLGTPPQSKP